MALLTISPGYNPKSLAVRFGCKRESELSYSNRKRISRLNLKLSNLLLPRLYFQILPIAHIGKGFVELKNKTRFNSVKLAKTVNGCTDIICFAATIGKAIEAEISLLMKMNHLADAFILDSMGSAEIESMVEKFWKDMKENYQKEGKAISLRFSPGYCDWKIQEQEKLFHFIDTHQVPITLSRHFLMSPRKSVSGIFGISDQKHAKSVSIYNPCHDCLKKGCIARRK